MRISVSHFDARGATPARNECPHRATVVGRQGDQAVEPEGEADLLGPLQNVLHRDRPAGVGPVDPAPEEQLHGFRGWFDAVEDLLDRDVVPLALAEGAEAPVAAFDVVAELLPIDRAGVAEALERARLGAARQRP